MAREACLITADLSESSSLPPSGAIKEKENMVHTLDFIAPLIPLAYAAGRIGNFINGELPGRIADASLPWAMIWPNVDTFPRHPSPIYQALVDGLLMFIILWIYARKERPLGAVSAMYAFLYGSAVSLQNTSGYRTMK